MASSGTALRQGSGVSYAWVILTVSFFTVFTIVSLRVGFGIYFQPIEAELGWTRTTLSLAVAINMLVYGFAQPVAGYFADRLGPKWVILASIALVGIGMLMLSATTQVWQLLLAYGVVVGAGVGGGAFVTQAALISRWFVRQRALALGIGLSGASAGQLFILPATMYLILTSGWRTAALALGLAICLLIIPLNLLLVRNEPRRTAEGEGLAGEQGDVSVGQAVRTQPFWMLTGSFTVCGVSITMLAVHLPGHVADLGFPPELAAYTLSAIGAGSIVGSVVVGVLSSRVPSRLLLGGVYALRGVAILLLLYVREPWQLWLFAVIAGFAWLATVTLTSTLTASVFGRAAMATIFGLISFGHQVGDAVGVLLGGVLHDLTGSYQIPFSIIIALLVVASAMAAMLDERATRTLRPWAR
ncbi:MAG: MFS transporter [Chloroflexi bacterium]|nr:MFS transporter [Chloroflexota bacterium]